MWPKRFSNADNTPDSLYDIALRFIGENLKLVTEKDVGGGLIFKGNVSLPTELCDDILDACQQYETVNDRVANLFRDRNKFRLTRIKIRHSPISDKGLRYLMEHQPKYLELAHCNYLTCQSLEIINSNSVNLKSVFLGHETSVFSQKGSVYQDRGYILHLPNLRKLSLRRRGLFLHPTILVKPLVQLTHLDITECASLGPPVVLQQLKNLVWLSLHNVYGVMEVFEWIVTLDKLYHLDISQSSAKFGMFLAPDEMLAELVTHMPDLVSLDISGTNLAGTGSACVALPAGVRCDIPGLASRVTKPLEFLGLYGTTNTACRRHDIPAVDVSGDANEKQILTAAKKYMHRAPMLMLVLNDLYYLSRSENTTCVITSLAVTLEAMDTHLKDKHIQISGCATLFYLIKGKDGTSITSKLRQRIILSLLAAMEEYSGDETMMRNGSLTLCQFRIPAEVLFEYERVSGILLLIVLDQKQEGYVQRIAMNMLNSMACQVHNEYKRYLGYSGGIAKIMSVISHRLQTSTCDEVLELAWATMWNATDEVGQNCEVFLRGQGMELFLGCLQTFPQSEIVLRNMMGLLGNVAEVQYLRPHLMTPLFLCLFNDLLDSACDGIEVSYNAAGVLAHIASDGPNAWWVPDMDRHLVLCHMAAAIDRWDLKARRNINYRSFEPILGLLAAHHTPQCKHWAVWALANLTSVYPGKYCKLLQDEGGIEILKKLLTQTTPYERIKQLASITIDNCLNYKIPEIVPEPTPVDSSTEN